MKDFIKKVIYFDIIYNLTNIFFSNTFFFEKGKIFQVIVDSWTFVFLIGWFVCGIIGIGIMKYLSLKIDKFIYESDALICYLSFIHRCSAWFIVLFFDFLDIYLWGAVNILIEVICFIIMILVLFRFWRYRIEISISMFLTSFIYSFTHWEKPFYLILNIREPNDFQRGLFILGILVIILPLILFLRKKGLYDFRSRKDKWLEANGTGPYQKLPPFLGLGFKSRRN